MACWLGNLDFNPAFYNAMISNNYLPLQCFSAYNWSGWVVRNAGPEGLKMARVSYLKRVGATYYARIDVPLDLVDIAKTTTRKKSLRTKDETDAKRLLWPVVEAWRREFDDMRSRRDLTDADKAEAVWQHYSAELTRDDQARVNRPTREQIDAATKAVMAQADRGELAGNDPLAVLDATLEIHTMRAVGTYDAERRSILASTMRKHLATGETALIEHEADAYIIENKLLVERGTPQYRDLCQRLQRATIEALERAFERDRGDYSGTPKDPIVRPSIGTGREHAAPGESIAELFDKYARENPKAVKPDTLAQARRDVGTFIDLVGSTFPARRIDKKAVRDWKALLLQYPIKAAEITEFRGMSLPQIVQANVKIGRPVISHKTVNRYLSGMGAFCSWLAAHDYIPANPMADMFLTVDKTSRATPFSVDQMNVVFASPLFTGCQNDDDWHKPGNHQIRDHRYWLPLVMLYSGARPAEIAQLQIADVREEHSQWVMHITTEGKGDKSVKNKGSMRVVPVHPELVALGFVSYREAMKAEGETRLFPGAVRNTRGQMVADFSRDFGRYLTTIEVKSGRGVSLYSFRHGAVDALRRAGHLDEQFGFLLGHASATMTGRYGIMPQGMLQQRVDLVNSIAYPGLDLKHLHARR
ncbi:site-specific integrase [Mesorhizobium sp. M0933]|uniref:site-specific integrase n=1 Tax=Mesorhizobium sp. M0933 TaxID=2957030 RepID=UPI00333AFD25